MLGAVTAIVLLALGAMLFLARDASPTAEDLDCARRYAEARTAADTSRVDATFPAVQGRGRGRARSRSLLTVSCGARRTAR
jgi:hypothetical protein